MSGVEIKQSKQNRYVDIFARYDSVYKVFSPFFNI